MTDFLIMKPLVENEDLFLKVLSRSFGMEYKLLKELHSYFNKDFYLIISMFAGQTIDLRIKKYPTVKELGESVAKIAVYKRMKDFFQSNEFLSITGEGTIADTKRGVSHRKALDQYSKEFSVTPNMIQEYYKEIREIVEGK